MPFGSAQNPLMPSSQVTLGQNKGNLYAPTSGQPSGTNSTGSSSYLGPRQIGASGAGPFDPAYRQNLAVYGGGQFAAPSSNWMFNPTQLGNSFGNPTGGGNAPVMGMPTTLLAQALGGNPFYAQSPAQQAGGNQSTVGSAPTPTQTGQWNWLPAWLQQYLSSGNNLTPGVQS